MDYLLLSAQQLEQVHLQKLLALETDHARLELDIRLAHAIGLDSDNVTVVRNQLAAIVRQIAILTSWVTPPPEEAEPAGEEAVEVSDNGQPAAVG